jgi:hypothetical protein
LPLKSGKLSAVFSKNDMQEKNLPLHQKKSAEPSFSKKDTALKYSGTNKLCI